MIFTRVCKSDLYPLFSLIFLSEFVRSESAFDGFCCSFMLIRTCWSIWRFILRDWKFVSVNLQLKSASVRNSRSELLPFDIESVSRVLPFHIESVSHVLQHLKFRANWEMLPSLLRKDFCYNSINFSGNQGLLVFRDLYNLLKLWTSSLHLVTLILTQKIILNINLADSLFYVS